MSDHDNGAPGKRERAQIWWYPLMERNIQDEAAMALLRVADYSGKLGYSMINMPYQRTDAARNRAVATFLSMTTEPEDALVMVDNDHQLPHDLIQRLTRFPTEVGVVGALAFRRGEPFDPCFFIRHGDDPRLATPGPDALRNGELLRGTIVGTGAICIRRWVFMALDEAGVHPPYFRYAYNDMESTNFPSEDVYFGLKCEEAGIPHFVDTSTVIPHLITSNVDFTSYEQYMTDHAADYPMIDIPVKTGDAAQFAAQHMNMPRMQTKVAE